MKQLLVADDSPDVVDSIREMLLPYFSVEVALTGLQILRLCEMKTFDGLIIDVDFGPGMSGLEIASIVRSTNKKIKILVFSATDYSNVVRQKVVDIGAMFCEKPLRLDLVLRSLEN